jgi:hypothetical protein
MKSLRLSGLLLAAATLLTTVLVTPADATTPGAATADRPVSRLTLTVKAPNGTKTTVHLDCQPAGGSHPKPERACLEVTDARGNLNHLSGSPDMIACTMEYRPVVAVARGHWHGKRVRWEHQYPNPCTLLYRTGVVFDF